MDTLPLPPIILTHHPQYIQKWWEYLQPSESCRFVCYVLPPLHCLRFSLVLCLRYILVLLFVNSCYIVSQLTNTLHKYLRVIYVQCVILVIYVSLLFYHSFVSTLLVIVLLVPLCYCFIPVLLIHSCIIDIICCFTTVLFS